jgi:hypothetical protein
MYRYYGVTISQGEYAIIPHHGTVLQQRTQMWRLHLGPYATHEPRVFLHVVDLLVRP